MPRRYREISEAEIIELIRNGTIRVCPETSRVFGAKTELKRKIDSDGYQWVSVRHNCGRRFISVHRLCWIAANLATVPDGCDIHHVNHNRADNRAANLEAIPLSINRGTARKPRDYVKQPGDDF